MEPDHSANIERFTRAYPKAKIVASQKAFAMMRGFFGTDFADRQIVVGEVSTLELGARTLTFVTAPMVHWPEVIVTYDSLDKVLFSADGFGRFGDTCESTPWADESRRYYIGIVGKYGAQVQALLKKAAALDIAKIAPLHGPVLTENLGYYLDLYNKWSSYTPEEEGILIAYTSVYGNTKKAALALGEKLESLGAKVVVRDLARCDIDHLTERGFKNRTVAFIENGSWAPMATKVMRGMLEGAKDITYTDATVKITSALSPESRAQLDALAAELAK